MSGRPREEGMGSTATTAHDKAQQQTGLCSIAFVQHRFPFDTFKTTFPIFQPTEFEAKETERAIGPHETSCMHSVRGTETRASPTALI